MIAAQLGCAVLVSLGGDIAVAGEAPAGGWRVRVTDDHAAGPDAPGQTVAINAGGLATSSTTVRAWESHGRKLHHIIDPATGKPARSIWRTVSVAAGRALDANIVSTACIVRGASAVGWLTEMNLPARLVREDGTARDHRRLAGRPSPGDRQALVTAALTGSAAPAAASAIVVTSKTWLWYLTRATGLVALVLLTASMALGLLSAVRWQRPGWPRFVTAGLHRNVSAAGAARSSWCTSSPRWPTGSCRSSIQDAVLPFGSAYRPLWLGLGAASFDLMLALIVTSLLRTRMSYRTWRALHWTAYLCWPAAVVHGLGTGTDTPVRWVLLLTLACVAADRRAASAGGWPPRHLAAPVNAQPMPAAPAAAPAHGRHR